MPINNFVPQIIMLAILAIHSWLPIAWRIQRNPALARGYFTLFSGWFLFFAILSGAHPLQAFYDSSGITNLIASSLKLDAAFVSHHLTTVLLLTFGTLWILVFGGAQMLQDYPGFFPFPVGSAEQIKRWWWLYAGFPLVIELMETLTRSLEKASYLKQMMPALIPLLLLLGVFAVIPYGLSIISGWRWLASMYRSSIKFNGTKQNMISGRMCSVPFRRLLWAGADPTGLHLGVGFLYRLALPPLFIPWEDLQLDTIKFLIFKRVVIKFRRAPGVMLSIPESAVQGLVGSLSMPLPEPVASIISPQGQGRTDARDQALRLKPSPHRSKGTDSFR